jgi:hypothetical protein
VGWSNIILSCNQKETYIIGSFIEGFALFQGPIIVKILSTPSGELVGEPSLVLGTREALIDMTLPNPQLSPPFPQKARAS